MARRGRVMRFRTQEGIQSRKITRTPVAVSSVTASAPTMTHVHGGAAGQVIFTAHDNVGRTFDHTITVTSSDPTKATVSPSSGKSPLTVTVTPLAAGSTNIVGTSNGHTATCADTVS
jgi:uncharacterized protein YjdB